MVDTRSKSKNLNNKVIDEEKVVLTQEKLVDRRNKRLANQKKGVLAQTEAFKSSAVKKLQKPSQVLPFKLQASSSYNYEKDLKSSARRKSFGSQFDPADYHDDEEVQTFEEACNYLTGLASFLTAQINPLCKKEEMKVLKVISFLQRTMQERDEDERVEHEGEENERVENEREEDEGVENEREEDERVENEREEDVVVEDERHEGMTENEDERQEDATEEHEDEHIVRNKRRKY